MNAHVYHAKYMPDHKPVADSMNSNRNMVAPTNISQRMRFVISFSCRCLKSVRA